MRPCSLRLHGLGDTGSSWRGKFHVLSQNRPLLRYEHPTASSQPVTCTGGVAVAWFDIQQLPVGTHEPEYPKGVHASVAAIHRRIDELVGSGLPAQNIILGGFSQGGAISIQAGLTYPTQLAGIVSISGWCMQHKGLKTLPQRNVPTFFSCGTADPVVDFSLSRRSGQVLSESIADSLSFMRVDRAVHAPKKVELDAAQRFMLNCLNTRAVQSLHVRDDVNTRQGVRKGPQLET